MYLCLIILILIVVLAYYYVFYRQLYSSNLVISGNTDKPFNKLMIVAHPDDELIFGGKALLQEKGWKVICLTNGTLSSNNVFRFNKTNYRKREFISVMNQLGYAYEIWDFEDCLLNANWNDSKLMINLNRIFERQYEKVISHNADGEYGHCQHKKVYQMVQKYNPSNWYVFHHGEEENSYLNKLLKILKYYSSQKTIIDKYFKYIRYQSYRKIN